MDKEIEIININKLTKNDINLIKNRLPNRYNHSLNYKNVNDFKRSIAGNLLLLNNIDNIKDEDIFYNEYKKPLIKNIYFNISHSNELVVFVKDNNIIGIDIEYIKENKKSIINKVFNENEIKYINNNLEKFYILWTIKESIVKAIGKGLSFNFKNIDSLTLLEGKSITINNLILYSNYIKHENYIISISSISKIDNIKKHI